MRDLLEGYDYLNAISSQFPNSIRKTAENYKANLLETSPYSLIDSEEDPFNRNGVVEVNNNINIMSDIEKSSQQLETLKNELRNITQERMIMDVINRQTFNLNRYPVTAKPVHSHSSTKSQSSNRNIGSKSEPFEFNNKLMRPTSSSSSSSRSQPNKTSNYRKLSTRKHETEQMEQKLKDSLLLDFIEIPSYGSASDESNKDDLPSSNQSTMKPVVRVRSMRDSSNQLVVPSLRQGPLPQELTDLKIGQGQGGPTNQTSLNDKKNKNKIKILPLTRYLYQKVKKNENDITTVKQLLTHQAERYVSFVNSLICLYNNHINHNYLCDIFL